jgi:hypothetical protein
MESKHITAVKVPWRRSNRNQPLGQILMTNQRSDQLATSRMDFTERGMLQGDLLDNVLEELRKLQYIIMFILINLSDASGNVERAADTLENGDNEHVLPSRTSDDPIDDEDDEAGIVSDPNCVLADVKLATTVRETLFSLVS